MNTFSPEIIFYTKNSLKEQKEYLTDKVKTFLLSLFEKSKWPYDDKLIVVLGGDGSLLDALKENNYQGIYLLIKEGGTVGFNSSFESIDDLLNLNLEEFSYQLEEHRLLRLTLKNEKHLAANEFTLSNPITPILFSLHLNDVPLYDYLASGLVIASKMGSTGFAHSLTGNVLLSNDIYEVIPIAPIDNNYHRSAIKSFVISKNDKLTVEFKCERSVYITKDMNVIDELKQNKVDVELIDKTFKLLSLKSENPYQRLKRCFK